MGHDGVDTDRELLRRCREGDPDGFRELVLRYETMVYTLAYRMLRAREEAEDAAQEVFLNVFRALPYFRGECTVKTWIYRVAANECITRSKRRRKRQTAATEFDEEHPGPTLLDGEASGPEALERKEQDERVRHAVDDLPEKYRMAVVLHYFEGLSYEEVGEALEIPMNTVKTWLFRAKGMLRARLKEAFAGDAR